MNSKNPTSMVLSAITGARKTDSYDLSHLSIGSIDSPRLKKELFQTEAGKAEGAGRAFVSPDFDRAQVTSISVVEREGLGASAENQAGRKGTGGGGAAEYQTELYMWGKNHFGQLGVPFASSKNKSAEGEQISRTDLQKRLDPQHYVAPIVAALDMPIAQIACGEEHTTLLTEDGLVFCMGSNASGQVGV